MNIRIDGILGMGHGETRTFDFLRNGRPAQGFLIKYHQGYHAYLNMCCHWPVQLDMGDGDFFSADADRIMCKTHGAVYKPDSGECDFGPCVNSRLDSYPVSIEGADVLITVPD